MSERAPSKDVPGLRRKKWKKLTEKRRAKLVDKDVKIEWEPPQEPAKPRQSDTPSSPLMGEVLEPTSSLGEYVDALYMKGATPMTVDQKLDAIMNVLNLICEALEIG